jgi:hypothetical protein
MKTIANYQLYNQIGAGAFGVAYLAEKLDT